jgi:hypothetical protein
MNEKKLHDDFMELGNMSDIDNRILAEAGQDDLIDRMHEQKEKDAVRKSPWLQEMKGNWFLYALLGVSFLLTETLAFYLGTAPSIEIDPVTQAQTIEFHTDFGHLATTLVYMLLFPIVTELAFDNSRKKFNKRETNNETQRLTMMASVVVSVLAWVGTGVAGAYVIFSTLGSLGFMEVPKSVQNYLVWIIPFLIAFFAVMNWLYESSSKLARSRKISEEQEANAELADQMRMQQIERAGKRAIRAAAIRSFEQAVAQGLLSQQDADTALAQGMSLADLERKLNRDITGEGKIGDTSGLSQRPAPKPAYPDLKPEDIAGYPDHYGPLWKNSTNITPTLDAYAWACSQCEGTNAPYTRACNWCQAPRTNGSAVTAIPNMPPAAVSSNGHKKSERP